MNFLTNPPRDLSKPLRWLESPPQNLANTPEQEGRSFLWGLSALGAVALFVFGFGGAAVALLYLVLG
jgi:hypothetical protein